MFGLLGSSDTDTKIRLDACVTPSFDAPYPIAQKCRRVDGQRTPAFRNEFRLKRVSREQSRTHTNEYEFPGTLPGRGAYWLSEAYVQREHPEPSGTAALVGCETCD